MMQKADFMGKNKEVRIKDLSRTVRKLQNGRIHTHSSKQVNGGAVFPQPFLLASSDVSSPIQLSVVSPPQILAKNRNVNLRNESYESNFRAALIPRPRLNSAT